MDDRRLRIRLVALMVLFPVLIGVGFFLYLGDPELAFGAFGITLIMSATVVGLVFFGLDD